MDVVSAFANAGRSATIIGGRYAFGAIDGILHGAQRDAATVETNINRGVSYDLPIMENYISLDDATIVQTFADAGYQTYNMLGEGEEGVDVMKIPSDVTLADAALAARVVACIRDCAAKAAAAASGAASGEGAPAAAAAVSAGNSR